MAMVTKGELVWVGLDCGLTGVMVGTLSFKVARINVFGILPTLLARLTVNPLQAQRDEWS